MDHVYYVNYGFKDKIIFLYAINENQIKKWRAVKVEQMDDENKP